jgi:adiponectin receptor
MISAVICLLCSAIFHLFYPMSGKYYMFFARFDYAGINILISGSIIPTLYYGLYCHPSLAQFYISCVVIIAIILFTASLFEFMHTPEFRTFKSICYGSFGIIVSVPLFHMLINEVFFPNGDKFTFVNSIPLFFALGASYLGGLVVYTKRCP